MSKVSLTPNGIAPAGEHALTRQETGKIGSINKRSVSPSGGQESLSQLPCLDGRRGSPSKFGSPTSRLVAVNAQANPWPNYDLDEILNALKEAPVKPAPESAKSVEGETAASDVKHNGIAKHPRSPFPELALNYAAALMAEELPELFAPPQASCLGSTVAATQAQMRAAYKLENQFRSAPLPSTLKPRIKQRLAEWLEKERALLKKQRDLGKPKKPDADKPGALKADDTAALIRAQAKLRQAGEVNDPELKLRLLQVGALCHRNAHHGVNRGGVDWGSHRDAVGKAYEVAIRHAHALAKQRDKSVADDLLAQIQNDCKQLSIKP